MPNRCSTSQVDLGRGKVTSQRRLTRGLPRCTRWLNTTKSEAAGDCLTDGARVAALDDKHTDLSGIPEITDVQMAQAALRVGSKTVTKGKARVNMYLDAAIVAYFKVQAGGRAYQTLINKALKDSIRAHDLEATLRPIIREEIATIGQSVQRVAFAKAQCRRQTGPALPLSPSLSRRAS